MGSGYLAQTATTAVCKAFHGWRKNRSTYRSCTWYQIHTKGTRYLLKRNLEDFFCFFDFLEVISLVGLFAVAEGVEVIAVGISDDADWGYTTGFAAV
jgi:hypothetical protein